MGRRKRRGDWAFGETKRCMDSDRRGVSRVMRGGKVRESSIVVC